MTKTPDDVVPEKFDLRSLDVAAEKRAELLRLFPEVVTEGGKVDFERLRAALGEQVDAGKERYGLTWPGKAACFQTIQRPSLATLRPKPGESVEFDTTQNVIVEGDNLEVLKLLQKSYLGKVKMIYIDPPYNTGNDFIYPDNYTESLQTYLEYTGQVDAEGRRFSTNTEADGRFHSKWLNMMYPRLYLARNLLREDGVIFISIDDHEVARLRSECDELFGAENLVAEMIWEGANKNDARQVGVCHEYVLVYARNRGQLPREWSLSKDGVDMVLKEARRLRTVHGDDFEAASDALAGWYRAMKPTEAFAHRRYRFIDARGVYKEENPTAPGGRRFQLVDPRNGNEIRLRDNRGWAFDQSDFNKLVREDRIRFVTESSIMLKLYLHETSSMTPPSVFYQPARSASERLTKLMGAEVFSFPKDEQVLQKLVEMATEADDQSCYILDFFAGAGTTAHAVLEQNKRDGGNRKFILVQLPERIEGNTDYPTIADITKERVRRVIKNLNDADKGQLRSANEPKPDRGFRVFQLAASNFKPWDGDRSKDATALKQQLLESLEHVLPDRSEQDLLYEILLKDGFELTTPIETTTVHGFRVHSVAGGELLLCLQDKLTHELITALADKKPSRVVFLDRGFRDNDQLKANAAKLFASKAGENFKKFKTV